MTKSDDKPYAVGYGRPPKHTQWPKGQSGNPRRKGHKRRESTLAMLDRLLMRPVKLKINGETKSIPSVEAIMTQLFLKELSGNARAARTLMKYRQIANQALEKNVELTFVDSDYTRAVADRPLKAGGGHAQR